MQAHWGTLLAAGSWWRSLTSSRGLGLALWIGLAIITLALLVLIRTRWGQTKPLAKCIALSVFAHILFLGYASGTKLAFDYPNREREESLRLSLIAPEDQAAEAAQDVAIPWEENFVAAAEDVPAPSPARQATDIELPESDAASAALPQMSQPAIRDLRPSEPLHETAATPKAPATSTEPAPSQVALETPPATESASTTPEPVAPALRRVSPADQGVSPETEGAMPPPLKLLSQTSGLQRLSQISIQSQQADAALASEDESARADNRDALQPPGTNANSLGTSRPQASDSDVEQLLMALPVVRRLGDSRPLPDLLRLRTVPNRQELVALLGGNAKTEAAVQSALAWLAENQEIDGRWSATRHGGTREDKVLGHDRQFAGIQAETGITGLALLTLLGAGHTHFEGMYRKPVQRGLEYLIARQKADGNLAGEARLFARMYCHGIASLALSEAYAMTGDDRLQPFVAHAVQFTVAAQHGGTGGWRYQPGDPGDTSQFGWQLLALRSAEMGGLAFPQPTRQNAQRFLSKISAGTHGGLASYRPGESPSPSMTAEALLCRLILNQHNEDALREAATCLLEHPPQDEQPNLYYWYYATLALFQLQGEDWRQWNESLQQQLLRRQHSEGPLAGSWDPDTVWGGYGGRVYSTSLAAMCLEVYYRYLPVLAGTRPHARGGE